LTLLANPIGFDTIRGNRDLLVAAGRGVEQMQWGVL